MLVGWEDGGAELFCELDLPFAPFPGLDLELCPADPDAWLHFKVQAVWYNPAKGSLDCYLEDTAYQSREDFEVAVNDLASLGWKEHEG